MTHNGNVQCQQHPFYEPHIDRQWLNQQLAEQNLRLDAEKISIPLEQEAEWNHKLMKTVLREARIPAWSMCRKWLWLKCLKLSMDAIEETAIAACYEQTIHQIYGKDLDAEIPTPKFVDRRMVNMCKLNADGIKATKRVLRVLAFNKPFITYSPIIQPIAALVCHYFEEKTCYAVLNKLTDADYAYLTRTASQWCALCEVIVSLLHRYSSTSVTKLEAANMLNPNNLFVRWAAWMFVELDIEDTVQLLDCIFFEGIKMVIRCAVSVTAKQMNAEIHLPKLKTIYRHYSTTTTTITAKPQSSDSKASTASDILRGGMALAGLKKTSVDLKLRRHEQDTKKKKAEFQMLMRDGELNRLSLTDNFVDQLLRKESTHMRSSLERIAHFQTRLADASIGSNQVPTNILMLEEFDGLSISRTELAAVWRYLPARVSLFIPTVLYKSTYHGRRVLTLYDRVEYRESFLLIVRTTQGQRLGAYASLADFALLADEKEESRRGPDRYCTRGYVGDGETFVFSFPRGKDGSLLDVYRWVGHDAMTLDSASGDARSKPNDMFISFRKDGLSIGGGDGEALFIDADLDNGETGRCLTFGNKPLITSGDVSRYDDQNNPISFRFKIEHVEVIGFEHS